MCNGVAPRELTQSSTNLRAASAPPGRAGRKGTSSRVLIEVQAEEIYGSMSSGYMEAGLSEGVLRGGGAVSIPSHPDLGLPLPRVG